MLLSKWPWLIILVVSLPVKASDVLVMTDSQYFIDQVTTKKGVGTISSVYSLIYEDIGLPNKLTLMPLNRQNRALDQTSYAACTLYRFKTEERAAKYLFSQPIYFMLHYKLYQQGDSTKLDDSLLNGERQIKSLTAIYTQRPNSSFLIMPSYSYGDVLDKQIASLPTAAKIDWSGWDPHNRLSGLFFSKRGEFALMFPGEVKSYEDANDLPAYYTHRIEGIPYTTKGYMMCNRHVNSAAYIETVNKSVQMLYSSDDYWQAHTAPYSDSEHNEIRATLKQLAVSH